MSVETNQTTTPPPAVEPGAASSREPKKIVNAQTVCNELNEKRKLCNGHLKQLGTGGEVSGKHLRGDDTLFKCQVCEMLYIGPPLGHLRDPDKQSRFVERELTALLLAAGGTMPIIVKNEKGAYVLAEESTPHAPAAAPAKEVIAGDVAEEKKVETAPAPAIATKPAGGGEAAPAKTHAIKVGFIVGADGPVPGETREQKIARLTAVSAEAKRRRELREAAEAAGDVAPVIEPSAPQAAATTAPAEAKPAESTPDAALTSVAPEATPPAVKAAPIPSAVGPVPGETFEQKIERLKGVVAEAKERAIREGKREA